MDFDDFVSSFKEQIPVRMVSSSNNHFGRSERDSAAISVGIKAEEEYTLFSWETGGVSGGSCWDESNPQPYDTRKEEPEEYIFFVFSTIIPELKFSDYREILKSKKLFYYTEYEYYGNCTDYAVAAFVLKEIYDVFNSLGYWSAGER